MTLQCGRAASRTLKGDFALTLSAAFPWCKCGVGFAFVFGFAFTLTLAFTFAFRRQLAFPFSFGCTPKTRDWSIGNGV